MFGLFFDASDQGFNGQAGIADEPYIYSLVLIKGVRIIGIVNDSLSQIYLLGIGRASQAAAKRQNNVAIGEPMVSRASGCAAASTQRKWVAFIES